MTRIRPSTWLLAFLLFFATAACLFAADSPQSSGSGDADVEGWLRSNWAKLWIPILVPSVIALLKRFFPAIPKAILPWLCPALGMGLSWVGGLTGQNIDPALAAALGAIGNWLRETYDQTRKAALPDTRATSGYVPSIMASLCLCASVANPSAGLLSL
jgi:MFS superfamily sulfate permease-like transporter